MIETLDAVFLEGRVFRRILGPADGAAAAALSAAGAAAEPLPRLGPAGSQNAVKVGFITGTALRNLRKKCAFYAGGQPVLLWGDPSEAHITDLLHRLQNVALLTKQRLLADFPTDDARSALAAFDRRLVLKGFGPLPDSLTRRYLLRGVGNLAKLLS